MRLALTFLLSAFALSGAAIAADWSYEGLNNGQDSWAKLAPEYVQCETGTNQSPIAIGHTTIENLAPLQPHYVAGQATISHKEMAIDVAFDNGGFLQEGDRRYLLRTIRFHAPSEHMIREKFYFLEMQLTHLSADGKILVLAIFAEAGNENPNFDALINAIPQAQDKTANISLDATQLLPGTLGYYAYAGSLSRPPCTENIEWRVLKKPVEISNRQLNAIASHHGRNSRLEQPTYMRVIKETAN